MVAMKQNNAITTQDIAGKYHMSLLKPQRGVYKPLLDKNDQFLMESKAKDGWRYQNQQQYYQKHSFGAIKFLYKALLSHNRYILFDRCVDVDTGVPIPGTSKKKEDPGCSNIQTDDSDDSVESGLYPTLENFNNAIVEKPKRKKNGKKGRKKKRRGMGDLFLSCYH